MNHMISLMVNGEPKRLTVASHHTLLRMLREQLHLTGPKNGCASGECGACSVLLNDELVNACLVLAVETDGAAVVTVEGLAQGEELHALQQAFLEHQGTQCGFCTPGLLMAAAALFKQSARPEPHVIRAGLAGTLCRCTAYADVVKAVQSAARNRR